MKAETLLKGMNMEIRIKENCVEIAGYVNAVERNS